MTPMIGQALTNNPFENLRIELQVIQGEPAGQKARYIQCPSCHHKLLAVYEDTSGHIEAKCKKCGRVSKLNISRAGKSTPIFH